MLKRELKSQQEVYSPSETAPIVGQKHVGLNVVVCSLQRERGRWWWQPQDPTPGGVPPQSLSSSVPEKHWNRDCWTEISQSSSASAPCEPRPLGDASGSGSAHPAKDFRHQEGKRLQSKQRHLIREDSLVF